MGRGLWLGLLGLFLLQDVGKAAPVPGGILSGTPLKIGDRVPDVSFKEVLNFSAPAATLSELRGKLTILDFWSTRCSGCVALFPHLQKVQEAFAGDLKILLVDAQAAVWHDDSARVDKALRMEGSTLGERITMPVILNSPELFADFPYSSLPHEVWLDSAGNVLAITDGYDVTEKNIRDMLAHLPVNLPTKMDVSGDLTKQSLMEVLSNAPVKLNDPVMSAMVYRGYLYGVTGNGVRRDEDGRLKGFYVVNEPLLELYSDIFREEMDGFSLNFMVVEASHPERFAIKSELDHPDRADYYSYDVSGEDTSMDGLLRFSESELNNTFHTKVFQARRRVRCTVVRLGPGADTALAGDGKPRWTTDLKDSVVRVRNYSMKNLVLNLNWSCRGAPFVWDGPETGAFNGSLPLSIRDRPAVIQGLRESGLVMSEEVREIKVVVITDQ
jgi:thiol-disulfide isomerase/thioredoxin